MFKNKLGQKGIKLPQQQPVPQTQINTPQSKVIPESDEQYKDKQGSSTHSSKKDEDNDSANLDSMHENLFQRAFTKNVQVQGNNENQVQGQKHNEKQEQNQQEDQQTTLNVNAASPLTTEEQRMIIKERHNLLEKHEKEKKAQLAHELENIRKRNREKTFRKEQKKKQNIEGDSSESSSECGKAHSRASSLQSRESIVSIKEVDTNQRTRDLWKMLSLSFYNPSANAQNRFGGNYRMQIKPDREQLVQEQLKQFNLFKNQKNANNLLQQENQPRFENTFFAAQAYGKPLQQFSPAGCAPQHQFYFTLSPNVESKKWFHMTSKKKFYNRPPNALQQNKLESNLMLAKQYQDAPLVQQSVMQVNSTVSGQPQVVKMLNHKQDNFALTIYNSFKNKSPILQLHKEDLTSSQPSLRMQTSYSPKHSHFDNAHKYNYNRNNQYTNNNANNAIRTEVRCYSPNAFPHSPRVNKKMLKNGRIVIFNIKNQYAEIDDKFHQQYQNQNQYYQQHNQNQNNNQNCNELATSQPILYQKKKFKQNIPQTQQFNSEK